MIDVLHDESGILVFRVLEKRRTGVRAAVDWTLRVHKETRPIARLVKCLRVLIVRRPDDGRADFHNHLHVGLNVRGRLRPPDRPPVAARPARVLVHVHAHERVRMAVQHEGRPVGRIRPGGIGIGVERHRSNAHFLPNDIEHVTRGGVFHAQEQVVEIGIDPAIPQVRTLYGAAPTHEQAGLSGRDGAIRDGAGRDTTARVHDLPDDTDRAIDRRIIVHDGCHRDGGRPRPDGDRRVTERHARRRYAGTGIVARYANIGGDVNAIHGHEPTSR